MACALPQFYQLHNVLVDCQLTSPPAFVVHLLYDQLPTKHYAMMSVCMAGTWTQWQPLSARSRCHRGEVSVTWPPLGDIIYDANEMWACLGHLKVSDESPAPSLQSITEAPPPVEAHRKPGPVLLWLMFRLMHLQDYLFWLCHLFVIAAAGLQYSD